MQFKSASPMLMIIDLQKAIDDPRWGTRNNPEAEVNIGKLLRIWREQGLPTLHVKHMSIEPNSSYSPSAQGNTFKDVVMPFAGEQVLEKDTNSAFIRTNLHAMLQVRGITEIVLVGVVTNNSVEATARMAGNLGYKTIVVADGTFTFNQIDFSGQEHAAEVVHNMALANMAGEYAQILTTKQVIECTNNLSEAG